MPPLTTHHKHLGTVLCWSSRRLVAAAVWTSSRAHHRAPLGRASAPVTTLHMHASLPGPRRAAARPSRRTPGRVDRARVEATAFHPRCAPCSHALARSRGRRSASLPAASAQQALPAGAGGAGGCPAPLLLQPGGGGRCSMPGAGVRCPHARAAPPPPSRLTLHDACRLRRRSALLPTLRPAWMRMSTALVSCCSWEQRAPPPRPPCPAHPRMPWAQQHCTCPELAAWRRSCSRCAGCWLGNGSAAPAPPCCSAC